jgi:RNase P/RNase MRP subunit p29
MFMNKDTAKEVLGVMNQVVDKMNKSLTSIRGECSDAEFQEYKYGVGGVMAEIYIRIRSKIYEKYPDLEP